MSIQALKNFCFKYVIFTRLISIKSLLDNHLDFIALILLNVGDLHLKCLEIKKKNLENTFI